MAIVSCKFCGQKFDREQLPFIQIPAGKVFRYAHPKCYKEAVANKLIADGLEICDPKDNIICPICRKALRKSSSDCMAGPDGRLMHTACAEKEALRPKTDQEKLYDFLIKECHWDYVPPGMQQRANALVEKEGLTYSGILGSLKYWIYIKGESLQKDNPLGIVPYIYEAAKEFYKKKKELREVNNKVMTTMKEEIRYITIKKPTLDPFKSSEFSFLDEEEQN